MPDRTALFSALAAALILLPFMTAPAAAEFEELEHPDVYTIAIEDDEDDVIARVQIGVDEQVSKNITAYGQIDILSLETSQVQGYVEFKLTLAAPPVNALDVQYGIAGWYSEAVDGSDETNFRLSHSDNVTEFTHPDDSTSFLPDHARFEGDSVIMLVPREYLPNARAFIVKGLAKEWEGANSTTFEDETEFFGYVYPHRAAGLGPPMNALFLSVLGAFLGLSLLFFFMRTRAPNVTGRSGPRCVKCGMALSSNLEFCFSCGEYQDPKKRRKD